MSVNLSATGEDRGKIDQIVKRALSMADGAGVRLDRLSLEMDLLAAHLNGCTLDLDKLLAAPAFDFTHDIWGIRRHIDRETGKLTGCFLPRCAMPERAEA